MVPRRKLSPRQVFCLLIILVVETTAQRKFRYAVTEPGSASYSHERAWQDDGTTQGTYRTLMPDGRWQIVRYHADDDGYKAHIRYEPTTPSPVTDLQTDSYENRSPSRWKFPDELDDPRLPAPPVYYLEGRAPGSNARIQYTSYPESPERYSTTTEPYSDYAPLPRPDVRQPTQSVEYQPSVAGRYRPLFEPTFPFFNPEKQQTEFHRQPNYAVNRPKERDPSSDPARPAAYDEATALLYGLHSIAQQNSPGEKSHSKQKKRPKPQEFYNYDETPGNGNQPQYTTPIAPIDLPFLQYPFDNTEDFERPTTPSRPFLNRETPLPNIPGLRGPFLSPQPRPHLTNDEEEPISQVILATPVPERTTTSTSRLRPVSPSQEDVDIPITFNPPPFPKKSPPRVKVPRPQLHVTSSSSNEDPSDRPIVFNPPPFPKKGHDKTQPKIRPSSNREENRAPVREDRPLFRHSLSGTSNHNQNSHSPTEANEDFLDFEGSRRPQFNNDDNDERPIVFNPPPFRPHKKNPFSSDTSHHSGSGDSFPPLRRPHHGVFGQRLRPLKRPSVHSNSFDDESPFRDPHVARPKPFRNNQNLFFHEPQFPTHTQPIDLFFPPRDHGPIVVIPPQTIIHPIVKEHQPPFIPAHAKPSSFQVPIFDDPDSFNFQAEAPPPLPPSRPRPTIRIHGHPSPDTQTQAPPRARAVDSPPRKSPVVKSLPKPAPVAQNKTVVRAATQAPATTPAPRIQLKTAQNKTAITILTSKPKISKANKPKPANISSDTNTRVHREKLIMQEPQSSPTRTPVKEEFMAQADEASAYTTASNPTILEPRMGSDGVVTVWAVALPLSSPDSDNSTQTTPNVISTL